MTREELFASLKPRHEISYIGMNGEAQLYIDKDTFNRLLDAFMLVQSQRDLFGEGVYGEFEVIPYTGELEDAAVRELLTKDGEK